MTRRAQSRLARAFASGRTRQLHRRFRELVRERRLTEAIDVGHDLIRRMPSDARVRRTLANCYARSGDDDRASEILLAGMPPEILRALEPSIVEASRAIDRTRAARVPPWRLLPKGVSNVCVVDHRLHDARGLEYVTKVIRGTRRHKEVMFYERVAAWSPEIARMAPRLLLLQELPRLRLVLLTIEKITGRQSRPDDSELVVRAHDALARHAFPQVLAPRRIPQSVADAVRREAWWRARRRIRIPETLSMVHDRRVNLKLLARLDSRFGRVGRPHGVTDVLRRLRHVVLDRGLHSMIVPDRDYGFLHGDFQTANLFVDGRSGHMRILDWESYRSGPPAIDLVHYLGTSHAFDEIEAMRAPRGSATDRDPAAVARYVVLVYGLLVSWLTAMTPKQLADAHDSHLAPAIERLEELVG